MTVASRRHGTWTANEAGVVAGVPLKSVHKIIDAGLLAGAVVTTGGTRRIGGRGVLAIKIAHRTRSTLTPAVRERMLTSILRSNIRVFRDDPVTVDVAAMEREVDAGRAALERARNAVTVDDGIMAGAPCLAGTRIPVHEVAALAASGESFEKMKRVWPGLTAEFVGLASVYAEAYPRRGRPSRVSARGLTKVGATKRLKIRLPA